MKRAGRFHIDAALVDEHPDRVRAVMAWVIVTAVQFHPYDGPSETAAHWAYEALGEQFAEIEDDAPLPLYRVQFFEGYQVQFYPLAE